MGRKNNDIKKYPFKTGFRHELEVSSLLAMLDSSREQMVHPHRVDFHQVIILMKGTATHVLDFKPVKIKAPAILFVRKGRVQLFDKQTAYDGKAILFSDNFFNKTQPDQQLLHSSILFNDLLDEPLVKLDKDADSILTLLAQLEAELQHEPDAAQYDILHNLLHNFLLLCERKRRAQGFRQIAPGIDLDYTTLFKDLLEAQYKTVRTVAAYAAQMHTTERRLTTATNKTIGKTPKQVIDERVMLEARRLLAHTHNSIKEVGYMLGFEEPTNFIKYFRKHEGKTPMEFKAAF